MASASNGAEDSEDEYVMEDGHVLDDLTGGDPGGDSPSSSSGDEEVGEDDARMVEDDSIHCFNGHQDAVVCAAWSPAHSDLVATGGMDDRGYLWRVGHDAAMDAASLPTFELACHSDTVVAAAFNATGTLLALASMDGTVSVWRSDSGERVTHLEGPSASVEWLCWHPKGDVVLAGSEDFMVWMWNATTGACMQALAGHCGPVNAGAFTHDGKAILTAGGEGDCSLRCWNPKSGECSATIAGHPFHEAGITCMAAHPTDAAVALTGGEDGSVRVSNVSTGKVLGSLSGHEAEAMSIEACGFSRHLPLAATAGSDGNLLVWDMSALAMRSRCQHPVAVSRMAWHPTQPLVFTACLDGLARLWDLRTGACVRQYSGHEDSLQDVALSPDGSLLLTVGDDSSARVFQTGV